MISAEMAVCGRASNGSLPFIVTGDGLLEKIQSTEQSRTVLSVLVSSSANRSGLGTQYLNCTTRLGTRLPCIGQRTLTPCLISDWKQQLQLMSISIRQLLLSSAISCQLLPARHSVSKLVFFRSRHNLIAQFCNGAYQWS